MRVTNAFNLPLLSKELLEQAARRRTYIIRTAYAVLFFGLGVLIFWGAIYNQASTPLELLGQGRELFMLLMVLQIAGVCLFTPALTCGTITAEKERNTFGLLMLTKLRPWTILLEKYLGRVVLMFSYLFISLPLFGFCYTLGGIDQKQVWFGFYGLVISIMQLGALGTMCSCYFRNTVGAFIATYLIAVALYLGPPFLWGMFANSSINFSTILTNPIWKSVEYLVRGVGMIGTHGLNGIADVVGIELARPYRWDPVWVDSDWQRFAENGWVFFAPAHILYVTETSSAAVPTWQLLAIGVPPLFTTVLFLVMARVFILRRAFATPKRYLLRFFQKLDAFFKDANNNSLTKGIVLIPDEDVLPDYEPLAWRETTKTTLGAFRYLVRILVAIEFPVLLICLFALLLSDRGVYQYHRAPVVVAVTLTCWAIAILLTVVRAATLIAGERTHETLDVLLTTPISSQQFILQKFRGVRRLMLVLTVPLLTSMVMQAWYCASVESGWTSHLSENPERSALFYLVVGSIHCFVYLPLFAWVSNYFGMWMKTSTRAIFASLAFIVAWMILPFILSTAIFRFPDHSECAFLLSGSPLVIPLLLEIGELSDLHHGEMVYGAVTRNILFHMMLLILVRRLCLNKAAKLLGRSEDDWS